MTTASLEPHVCPDIEALLADFPTGKQDELIPILLKVQERLGYLSREAVQRVAQHLEMPTSQAYSVATFYNHFRFKPLGRFHIQVCRGTACHVKNSLSVYDAFRQELNIDGGDATKDGAFSLEGIACIGACGLAPVVCINGEYYPEMTSRRVANLLEDYRERLDSE